MQRKTILIIIIITSSALAGIFFTQVYWVKTAFELKEEQFDNSVRIATKSVINQFLQKQNDTIFQNKLLRISCRKDKLDIWDYMDSSLLDSLISNELKNMAIVASFNYGVYSKYNNKFVMGKYHGHNKELLNSQYQFSLSSIYKPGDYYLSVIFDNKAYIILHRMELWVVLSVVFVMILTVSFIFVVISLLHQKKISEIKTDFINNMTHEFKTPIATSTLAAEMIQRKEVLNDPEKINKYSSIILDENSRLQSQVEQVLQVAILESGRRQFRIKRINVNRLVESALNSFELRIKESGIKITTKLEASNPNILGDKVHVLNVFYNLIDNAIKYSPANPEIRIRTYNLNGNVVISVKDKGIGISKEHQKNIFKNLFRVPIGDIHEVRGFGLGLYYVKTIVDQFGGKIEVTSEPSKGSDFCIFFPTISTKNINNERG